MCMPHLPMDFESWGIKLVYSQMETFGRIIHEISTW